MKKIFALGSGSYDGKFYILDLTSLGYPLKIASPHPWKPRDKWAILGCIFVQHQYSIPEVHVESGDTLIDAGAHIGDTALKFLFDTQGKCRIYSFEFLPEYIETCTKNIALNFPELQDRLKVIPLAISDVSDQKLSLNIFSHPDVNLISGSFAQPLSPLASAEERNCREISVKTITIDDFVERNKIEKIDFIKMDIEGAEGQALQGASETLKRFHPKLAFSLYHLPTDPFILPELIAPCYNNPQFFFRLDGEPDLYVKEGSGTPPPLDDTNYERQVQALLKKIMAKQNNPFLKIWAKVFLLVKHNPKKVIFILGMTTLLSLMFNVLLLVFR